MQYRCHILKGGRCPGRRRFSLESVLCDTSVREGPNDHRCRISTLAPTRRSKD